MHNFRSQSIKDDNENKAPQLNMTFDIKLIINLKVLKAVNSGSAYQKPRPILLLSFRNGEQQGCN